MAALEVDGTDVATHGVIIRRLPGFLSGSSREWDGGRVHGVPGENVSNRVTPRREIPIEFDVNGDGVDPAVARARVDAFKFLLAGNPQPKSLVFGHDTTRKLLAEFQSFTADIIPGDAEYAAHVWRGVAVLVATDPHWRAVTESNIGSITTTPVALPQGTAPPYRFRVRILGGSNHVLTLKDYTGATVATLSFTGANGGSDYLCIEMDEGRVYLNTTGVFGSGTKVSSRWNGEPFFRPDTAWWRGGDMTLECSSGTAQAFYDRAWE